jgi:hypothetical protein
MNIPENLMRRETVQKEGPIAAAKEFLDGLAHRYPALTTLEITKLLLSLCSSRARVVGQVQLDVGEVYVVLGWANSIKIQQSLLRRITHAKPRVKVDVQRGKAGVVEYDVDYKGPYFRTMAQQEAREEERLRQSVAGPQTPRVPIGTRIRFVQDVEEPEDEESPLQVFARKGQFGKVTGHNSWKSGHYVETEKAPGHTFSAEFKAEFVVAEEGQQ